MIFGSISKKEGSQHSRKKIEKWIETIEIDLDYAQELGQ